MARLQILELPEGSGDDRPPFVLVIDQADDDLYADLTPTDTRGHEQTRSAHLAEQIGALAVLCFHGTIDIPANEVPVDADGNPLFLKVHVQGEFEQFRAQAEEEITKAHDAVLGRREALMDAQGLADERTGIARDMDRLANHKAALLHALGMDSTRDWDDIRNAAAGLRKQRDAQAEAIERVRRAPTKPDAMNAQQESPSAWLHGYECGVIAAKSALRPCNEPTSKPTDA